MLANISIEVILGILIFFFKYIDINFGKKSTKRLFWQAYIIAKTMSTAKQVELIIKYKFARVILNKNLETFIMHMAILKAIILIYLFWAILVTVL